MTVAKMIELLEWAKDQVGEDAEVTVEGGGNTFVLRTEGVAAEDSETGIEVRVILKPAK